jgi:hypothetical protein
VNIISRLTGRRVQFSLIFTETLWTRFLAGPEAKEVRYIVATGVNRNMTFT